MKNWFANFIHPRREPAAGEPALPEPVTPASQPAYTEAELLAMQKEVQSLRMEIQARNDRIAGLKQEIERLRLRQDEVIAETVASHLGGLFSELAAPSSQILTQADLLERQDKPVQARDILAVARRMVRALERAGVVFIGQVGEQVTFNPNQHTPINGTALPQPGQAVTVRFAGVVYEGKILYKAVVE
jgi:molecular chaperone GrpE (heat shock protein)